MGKIIKTLFLIFLFIFSFSLFGSVKVVSKGENSITLLYQFGKINFTKNDNFDFINIEDTQQYYEPGKPIIPVRTAKIIVPEGKGIEKIEVIYNYEKISGNYILNTAQIPQKIGENKNYTPLKFSGTFPEKNYSYKGTQIFKGYKVALIEIYPVRYNSLSNEIEVSKDVYLKVSFKDIQTKLETANITGVRGIKEDEEEVKSFVDDPEEINIYPTTKYAPLETYKYVIITSDTLKNSFAPLIASKTGKGLSATIVTTDYIYSNFTGADKAEKIRNFIIWAYNNWNTEYVLLGGDVDIIPIRYFYNPVEGSSNPIPTDVYYSNLDGTFDNNGNGIYGEYNDGPGGGDIDFLPEVYVGRAPVDTPSEVDNFVNKVLGYEGNDTKSLKKAGMVGKKLDDIPTWGGDGKDEVAKIIPDDWNISKFYDRDGTFSVSAVSSYINSGTHFVNIFTHGSHGSCASFSVNDIENLSNSTYPIIYSQGCYNSSLDELPGDAVGEVFVTTSHGAVSFVGNTRYGWYSPGAVQYGPSQIFDEEFFSVLFKENFAKLGDAFYRSKANLAGSLSSYNRYVYLELILLGDPELDAITPSSAPSTPENPGYTYYVKDNNIYKYSFQDNSTTQITYFTSGTILNPVLSEDGEKILFSYSNGGDYEIYWINSDGSGQENLSITYNLNQATKNQKYAALSPDQTLLAFTAESIDPNMPGGQQVWLKELTGQKRLYQLTFNNPETLSLWNCYYPVFIDDTHILFKADDFSSTLQDYWVVSTAGTDLTNITKNSLFSPYFPRLGRPMLNSDKTMIIYGKQTQDTTGYSDWEIYTRSVPGGAETKVLTGLYYAEAPDNQPDPMPAFVDTGQFIFRGEEHSTGDLYLYYTIFNTDSPYLNKLQDTSNASFPYYFVPLPQPDQFVYVSDNQIWLRTYEGEDKKLTDTVNSNDFPCFDINANYIAYSGNGIWVMKADGTDPTQVDDTCKAKYPVVSPDGEWVFYLKDNDIYARRIDKSVLPQKLTNTPQYAKQDLDISPDGKKLIYSEETSSGFQIFSLSITIFDTYVRVDGQPENLTNDVGHENYNPSFSPDGSRIVFVSTRNGSPAIFIMNSDGTDTQLVNLTPAPVNPAYPVFNPYGENEIAYIISNGEVYIGDIDTQQAQKLSPSIQTYNKFDWSTYTLQKITVTRQFIYSKVDPNIPFRYRLIVDVSEINPPSNIILQEVLPETPDSAVDWGLVDSTWQDTQLLPANNATTGTLKWILGTSFPMDNYLSSGVLELTLDISGDNPDGALRCLNGGFYEGENYYTTKGDAYISIGQPPCPADTDQDWKISDEELLNAIDYWAANTQINGWPEDLNNWDIWLLKLIDFWADNDGYEYDSAESIVQQKPWWKTK